MDWHAVTGFMVRASLLAATAFAPSQEPPKDPRPAVGKLPQAASSKSILAFERAWPTGKTRIKARVLPDSEGHEWFVGVFVAYHENGQLAERGTFTDGFPTGEWQFFHPNGKPLAKGKCEQGERIGPPQLDLDAPTEKFAKCGVSGVLATGIRGGAWSLWSADGALDTDESGVYRFEQVTDPSGDLAAQGSWLDGKRDGMWTSYFRDGRVRLQASFRRGVRHGEWRCFHADGKLETEILSGRYEKGRRIAKLEAVPATAIGIGREDPLPRPALPAEALARLDAALDRFLDGDALARKSAASELAAFGRAAVPAYLTALQLNSGIDEAKALRLVTLLHATLIPSRHPSPVPAWMTGPEAPHRWRLLWEATRTTPGFWELDIALADEATRTRLLTELPVAAEEALLTRPSPPAVVKETNVKLQPAISGALDWLARHQDASGAFLPHEFARRCAATPCGGSGERHHITGVTGIATLALLEGGRFDEASRGLRFLIERQDVTDGALCVENKRYGNFDHAVATYALVRATRLMSGDAVRIAAQMAIAFIGKARNPYRAWRDAIADGDNEVTQTGWMLLVLAEAKAAGLGIDADAVKDALTFIDDMTDPQTGRVGPNTRGGHSLRMSGEGFERWPVQHGEAITAEANFVRLILGLRAKENPVIAKGCDLVASNPPIWGPDTGRIDFYYWYFGTRFLRQIGGRPWERWRFEQAAALLDHQLAGECAAGSWDPQVDPWGAIGGRVCSTAMNALTLMELR